MVFVCPAGIHIAKHVAMMQQNVTPALMDTTIQPFARDATAAAKRAWEKARNNASRVLLINTFGLYTKALECALML